MKDILKNNINNAINSLNQKDINQAIDYIYSSLSEIEIDSKIFTNVEIMRYANLKEGENLTVEQLLQLLLPESLWLWYSWQLLQHGRHDGPDG